jgi:hypothetical protein
MSNTPGLNKLIAIIQDIAQGNYSDDIMALTGPEQPEDLRHIAEAMAMMMVKVEAREFHLENLAQELRILNRDLKRQAWPRWRPWLRPWARATAIPRAMASG